MWTLIFKHVNKVPRYILHFSIKRMKMYVLYQLSAFLVQWKVHISICSCHGFTMSIKLHINVCFVFVYLMLLQILYTYIRQPNAELNESKIYQHCWVLRLIIYYFEYVQSYTQSWRKTFEYQNYRSTCKWILVNLVAMPISL